MAGRSETKYRNTISDTLGEIQTAIRGTDAKMQLLGAGLGATITETEEGPMSVWEAIQLLRSKVKLAHALGEGHHLYLDDLKKNLPNWGVTLENLSKSYQENLPKIGTNLQALGEKIRLLQNNQSTGSLNPFLNLGLDAGNLHGNSFVLQGDFNKSKAEIEEAFREVRTTLQEQGGNGAMPTGLTSKVDKALKRLGEIEGRVTGESFSMSNQTFCSKSEVADWLLTEKVPSCGFFWDLFSVMVSMKPKKHSGKERSDESYSARRTNSTTLENDLGAAMTHVRPEVLYAKKLRYLGYWYRVLQGPVDQNVE